MEKRSKRVIVCQFEFLKLQKCYESGARQAQAFHRDRSERLRISYITDLLDPLGIQRVYEQEGSI